MDYIINGGNKLYGELSVCGAKNCALALLGATVLTTEDIVLENCPQMVDVENMLELLLAMGKKVIRQNDTVTVGGALCTTQIPRDLAGLLRGSGLLLGSTVAKHNSVFLPLTGGCAIGKRPIDIHLDGLRTLGLAVQETDIGVFCEGTPSGGEYALRFASVGATENLLCAAVLAQGQTVLKNCAREPEVVALARLLQKMGAKIGGIGSSTLTICGVERLHGATFKVIPDRIVAATYLACVAAAGGKLKITNCCPRHFDAFLKLLAQRFLVGTGTDWVQIEAKSMPRDYGKVITAPYPKFPTDMQQILVSLCALSDGGCSVVREKLFENRLQHNADQLALMGANIQVEGDSAIIVGSGLHGATVYAKDLRGGAALVVAALGAVGCTRVCNVEHILRGYYNLDTNLRTVGADIILDSQH